MTFRTPAGGLSHIVRALGGDLYAGGRRGLVPAPGHSAHDRSVSLRLQDGRVLAHCFGGGDWREVLDDLRARGWIDHEHRLLEGGVPVRAEGRDAADPTRADRIGAARRLWDEAGPIADGDPAARHIALRGVDPTASQAALRSHAAAPAAAYRDRGPRRPALLAAVQDPDGRLTAVEVTYIDVQGRRSALARPSRKVVGVLPAGCAVRLAPTAASMVVGEGVFTTLSAMRRLGLPGWALLSTGNLRRWRPTADVRRVIVAGDRGSDGERSAATLCAALRGQGLACEVRLPPEGFGDWNDLDRKE